ncbi:hypothetical protein CLV60_115194 [Dyadobacter jiangsuensis]|uniref:Uncharacterized protein n=1 Tax=Dyadobacter jiangsuensis TaxID=1591085 RepID=A0A2P8FQM3_9BACT|nr:hypothetical protein CLV60_115194 [Dyadobacter jiangsuensis]
MLVRMILYSFQDCIRLFQRVLGGIKFILKCNRAVMRSTVMLTIQRTIKLQPRMSELSKRPMT